MFAKTFEIFNVFGNTTVCRSRSGINEVTLIINYYGLCRMKAITVKISKLAGFKETNTARTEHHKDASVILWHHVMIRE